jgi:cyclopropane-fatty-acyl-phospholipid synthase|tara:strand:+ start:6758 stop:8104 length:1347 start_codon:yes stop_codon:yes gene_type:complete
MPSQTRGRRAVISERVLKAVLSQIIRTGTLRLRLPDDRVLSFGRGAPVVAASIHDWKTVRRLAFNPDLALGEAYMEGSLTVTSGDIYDFLAICLANLGVGSGHWLRRMRQRLRWLGRRFLMHNPVGRAQQNVAHHYDLSDDLYDLFLDAERQYSCAYYETSQDSLEEAQARKMRHIAAKLRLQDGLKVLDIGSGWGGLALSLVKAADADVTGVTLSVEQQRYAEARAEREGLSDRARFQLKDYRQETGRYDRIVSVGMFEHVGAGYYNEYFAKLAELLSDDGVAMIHTIGSVGEPAAPHPWIRKYIFPGGYIPSLSEITPAIERSGLIVTDLEVLRLHYAETLKAWRARFLASREKVIALYDERFCRMWDFYLAACEAAFRYNGLVVFQFQLTKQVTTLPIVRNYIAQDENRLAITADAGCARTSPAAASAAGDRPPRVTRNELTASV